MKMIHVEAISKAGLAFSYHRGDLGIGEILKAGKFLPGFKGGMMYGRALYTCYDLSSQLRSRMFMYGPELVKLRTDLSKALVFDYNISKLLWGERYSLVDQLVDHGAYRSRQSMPKDLLEMSSFLEKTFSQPTYSAEIAYNKFCKKYIQPGSGPTISNVSSLLFTGNQDGNVLLIYEVRSITPIAFAIVDKNHKALQTKNPNDIDWISLLDKDLIQRTRYSSEVLSFFKNRKGLDVTSLCDPSLLRTRYNWLFRAEMTSSSKMLFTSSGFLVWVRGDWLAGTWEEGLFTNADFKMGVVDQNSGAKFCGIGIGVQFTGSFLEGIFGLTIDECPDSEEIKKFFKEHHVLENGTKEIPEFLKGYWKAASDSWISGNAKWTAGEIFDDGWQRSEVSPPEFIQQKLLAKNSTISGGGETQAQKIARMQAKYGFIKQTASTEATREAFHEQFDWGDLDSKEREELYQAFAASYIKATGATWDKSKFQMTASGWTFFGDLDGGIAVRKQRSGMLKLNACYGNFGGIMKAYREMDASEGGTPIWGVMTEDLCDALEKISRKKFRQPPSLFVATIIPHIKHIFGAEIKDVKKNGDIMVDTPAGVMAKRFIANQAYFDKTYHDLKDQADSGTTKLPVPKPVASMLLGIMKMFLGVK